jgi:hypothetical protein
LKDRLIGGVIGKDRVDLFLHGLAELVEIAIETVLCGFQQIAALTNERCAAERSFAPCLSEAIPAVGGGVERRLDRGRDWRRRARLGRP